MKATDHLRHDHELIMRGLGVLHVIADRVERREPLADEPVQQILAFFRDFADTCHHAKEEDTLFPALAARGIPGRGGPIAVMLQEHQEGRSLLRALADAAGDLEHRPEARARFADAARDYEALLGAHIDKENEVLFHLADRVLDAAEDARILAAFEHHERRLAALGEHAQQRRTIEALAAQYL
jgi:hemerythrin-like domain-containing protein